jgi:hypothetical protein
MPATIEKGTLAAAMAVAFKEIEAATKDATNPHFKNKYAGLPQVIEAIKPALVNHGLFFTQRCHPAEDGVSVETVLHHSGGEMLSLGILYLPANKRDAQGFGSALTYARRYALMTAFGVPAEDDDGNAAAKSTAANDRQNGNGFAERQTAERNTPFPPGPARNKTELKTMIRQLWSEVEGCGDPGELDALLKSKESIALVNQTLKAEPDWWEGRTGGNMPFEGLEAVISRKQTELAAAAVNAG